MSENFPGFDPADLFRRQPGRRGPRVVRSGPLLPRRRRILLAIAAVIVIVLIVAFSLVDLRVQYLFLDNLDHTNVFWTPLVAKIVLFIIGFLLAGVLVALNIPGFAAAAGALDRNGARVAVYAGIALAVVSGIIAGSWFAGQWQDVLLWGGRRSSGCSARSRSRPSAWPSRPPPRTSRSRCARRSAAPRATA
ncbi:MAG: hypothetical protein E6J03_13570 [Chloroflexi bacterium]|nr:MAG: hypothetical protein E6J03_13570 [Chloroflexota bacterium]